MNDTYPIGYFEARNQYSAEFLAEFDRQVNDLPYITFSLSSYFPSVNSPLFCITLPILLCISPILVLASYCKKGYNHVVSDLRSELFSDLIATADNVDSDKRIELIQGELCFNAFKEKTFKMKDLSTCPLDLLEHMAQPTNLAILKDNELITERNKTHLKDQLLVAERELTYLKDERGIDSQEYIAEKKRISELNQNLDAIHSLMEQIRDSNYNREFILSIRAPGVSLVNRNSLYQPALNFMEDDYRERDDYKKNA